MTGSWAEDRDTAIQTDPMVWLLDSRQRSPAVSIREVRCLASAALTSVAVDPMPRAFDRPGQSAFPMRVRNSLRSAKVRDKNCRVVRRRGRVYVINKKNPRMKARQG